MLTSLTAYDRQVLIHIQLVRDLPIVGGDERKVGYYTGIIVRASTCFLREETHQTGFVSQVSLHYASEGTTVFFWNRLSDHIGRKPVLLCCLAGSAISMVLFGLSRSFLAIVLRCPHSSLHRRYVTHWFIHSSRCLHGALRGNIGVVKSAMAELTDESNAPRGFSLLHMTWSIGFIIGSVTIYIYYVLSSLTY